MVINLATNDDNAFHTTDSQMADVLRMDGEAYVEEDLIKVSDAIADFMTMVRRNNPNAYIIWAFGMIETGLSNMVRASVKKYCEVLGDNRAEYLALPATSDETMGSRCHPGRKNHEQAAKVLSERIDILVREGKVY